MHKKAFAVNEQNKKNLFIVYIYDVYEELFTITD